MNHWLGRIIQVNSGYRGNVMTPLNWMISVIELLFTIASIYHSQLWLYYFTAGIAFMVFYCIVYTYFVINDPNRLQTEEYNLANQQLILSNQKGKKIFQPSETKIVKIQSAASVETINNNDTK